jgi:hypothetical protein
MAYFLIHNSDGDTTVYPEDPEQLCLDITRGDYGDDPQFLDRLPDEHDTNCWPEGAYLLIRGEIVTPKPKQVTTKWTVD